MSRNVSFTDFVKNNKDFKSGNPDSKLRSIFQLFDNNNEGILRKHEVRYFNKYLFCIYVLHSILSRQIIFSLYLIKNIEIQVKERFEAFLCNLK